MLLQESIKHWIDSLAGNARHDSRLVLDLPECRIELRSNSPELVAKMRAYFHDVVSLDEERPCQVHVIAIEGPAADLPIDYTPRPPEPGKQKIKEEFVEFVDGRIVRKKLTGMLFLFGGSRQIAYGPCLANDNQVVNFINSRYLHFQVQRGALLCHAAGVAVENRGLALAGLAGRGKSTLALHLLSRGADFVSNDRLLIRRDKQFRMLGIPKLPRINPGTVLHNPQLESVMSPAERAAVAHLPPDQLWSLEQKYDVYLDQCFGPGHFRMAAEMTGLVMLTWQRNSHPLEIRRVRMVDRPDLLDAFRKTLGLFTGGDDDELGSADGTPEEYTRMLGDCPVFEFAGGVDFDRAAEVCLRFMREGSME